MAKRLKKIKPEKYPDKPEKISLKPRDWRETSFIEAIEEELTHGTGWEYVDMYTQAYEDEPHHEIAARVAELEAKTIALTCVMEAAVRRLPVTVLLDVKAEAMKNFIEWMAEELNDDADS